MSWKALKNLTRPSSTVIEDAKGAYPDGREPWYSIVDKSEDDETVVYIYDEISWWGVSAADFSKEFTAIKTGKITLRVNSPGGDVFDGIAIMNTIKDHPATVTCVVDGLAASAASYLIQAADSIVMNQSSQIMIHDAIGVCVGNRDEMNSVAELLDKISANIAEIYAEKTGKSVKYWRDLMLAETWYSAEEAVNAGLADSVADKGAPKDHVVKAWDLSAYRFQGRASAPAPKATVTESNPRGDSTNTGDEWDFLAQEISGMADTIRASVEAAGMSEEDTLSLVEQFDMAVRDVANNAPAPPKITETATEEDTGNDDQYVPIIDASEFYNSVRKGL